MTFRFAGCSRPNPATSLRVVQLLLVIFSLATCRWYVTRFSVFTELLHQSQPWLKLSTMSPSNNMSQFSQSESGQIRCSRTIESLVNVINDNSRRVFITDSFFTQYFNLSCTKSTHFLHLTSHELICNVPKTPRFCHDYLLAAGLNDAYH